MKSKRDFIKITDLKSKKYDLSSENADGSSIFKRRVTDRETKTVSNKRLTRNRDRRE